MTARPVDTAPADRLRRVARRVRYLHAMMHSDVLLQGMSAETRHAIARYFPVLDELYREVSHDAPSDQPAQ